MEVLHGVTHRPETGPEGCVPRVRRPQVPCRWQRRCRETSQERAPTPWRICGVLRKAEGCPSWDGAGNAYVGWRDRAVPGALLGAGAMRGGRRRRPRRGSAPCLGAGSPVCPPSASLPGRNSRPGCSLEIIPSPLGSLLGSRDRVGRGLRWRWGRPDRPFPLPWRRLCARARRSENPCFSHVFLRGGQLRPCARTLEPRPREQRGGPCPPPPPPPPAAAPCPPHAADRRRSPAVPRWLRKGSLGGVMRDNAPALPGSSLEPRQARRPCRSLRAESDRPGAPELWQPHS